MVMATTTMIVNDDGDDDDDDDSRHDYDRESDGDRDNMVSHWCVRISRPQAERATKRQRKQAQGSGKPAREKRACATNICAAVVASAVGLKEEADSLKPTSSLVILEKSRMSLTRVSRWDPEDWIKLMYLVLAGRN